ncbi:hypothetical protein LTX96_0005055, partial [Nakaseomyces glabratus]
TTTTHSPPAISTIEIETIGYHEIDYISYYITTDSDGNISTAKPAPSPVTNKVNAEDDRTNYEVVSFWTTTNEFGGLITTSSTRTYSAPPLTVTATTGEDYVESDWISFFITVDEKGEIVTSSTLFNATRDYIDAEAQHPTFGTPPLPVTSTIEVTEGVTEYVVVSYYTTTNEYGGVITTSTTITHSPPTVSTIAIETDGSHGTEYISSFITTDSDGKISTGETRLNQGHQSSSKGKSSDLASQTKEGISEKPEAVWTDISQSREHSLPTSVKSNEVGNEVGSGTISEETTQSTSRNTGSHNSEYQISNSRTLLVPSKIAESLPLSSSRPVISSIDTGSSHSEVHGHASGSAIKNSKDNEGISPSTVNGGSVPVSSNTNTHREGSVADVSSNNKPNYSSVPTNTIQSRSRTRVTLSSTDTRASGGSTSTSASNLISELSDSHDLTGSASSITFLGIKKCIILLIIVVVSIA